MAYCIFLTSLRILEEFRKILVSKYHLNLLVEILKVLPNSEIYLNSKIKTLLIFFFFPMELAQSATPAHSFPVYLLPRPAQQARVLRRRPTWFLPPS
jgi:hypothetical protein